MPGTDPAEVSRGRLCALDGLNGRPMPAPSNATEFIELVRRSGVVDEDRLSSYLKPIRASGAIPSELNKLAGLLVRDGVITLFQAEQFLQGKWKRFTIGRYKVLERLGSGGMGQVFLCEHKLMRRRVAIKVLPSAKAEDPAARERFYREARAVAALDHPNLVRAFDIDRDETLHFLVMEYVDGVSFHDVVKRFGPMDPLRACHYIRQAAAGLDHAHAIAGLIHRDIKPGNVLIDRAGVVKILDMGLARFFNDESDILTRKYDETVLGTADYLSPEQALDSHNVDIRADIYSLGATFYFVLTGRPPFPDGTVAQKLLDHQAKEPQPIRGLRPEVPAELARIVETMMRKAPDQRYQVPAEVVDALMPLTAVPIPPPPDQEMPVLSLAAMAGAGPTSISARLARQALNRSTTFPVLSAAVAGHSSARVAVVSDSKPPPVTRPAEGSSSGRFNPFRSLLAFATSGNSEKNERSLLEDVYSPTDQSKPHESHRHPVRRPLAWVYAAGATLAAVAAAAGYWLWRHLPV